MNIPRSLCCLLTWSLLLGLPLGCSKKQEASATSTAVSLTPASEEGPTPTWAGTSGRGSILQLPMDNAAKLVMLNIGRSYQMATVANGKPPRNAEDASLEPRNLKTKRDMQDREVEVVYGVDVKQLGEEAPQVALAWEKTPDNNDGRMVLMADFVTVRYVSTAEFETMKKARQK